MENNVQYYDVVVVEKTSRSVNAVVGTKMFLTDGYYSTVQRRNTYRARVSKAFTVEIVPTGLYKKGDFVPEDVRILP